MDIYHVIKEPHIAEKGNIQKELNNQISLKVDKKANKKTNKIQEEVTCGPAIKQV